MYVHVQYMLFSHSHFLLSTELLQKDLESFWVPHYFWCCSRIYSTEQCA